MSPRLGYSFCDWKFGLQDPLPEPEVERKEPQLEPKEPQKRLRPGFRRFFGIWVVKPHCFKGPWLCACLPGGQEGLP